jgi:hypothetical protein
MSKASRVPCAGGEATGRPGPWQSAHAATRDAESKAWAWELSLSTQRLVAMIKQWPLRLPIPAATVTGAQPGL